MCVAPGGETSRLKAGGLGSCASQAAGALGGSSLGPPAAQQSLDGSPREPEEEVLDRPAGNSGGSRQRPQKYSGKGIHMAGSQHREAEAETVEGCREGPTPKGLGAQPLCQRCSEGTGSRWWRIRFTCQKGRVSGAGWTGQASQAGGKKPPSDDESPAVAVVPRTGGQRGSGGEVPRLGNGDRVSDLKIKKILEADCPILCMGSTLLNCTLTNSSGGQFDVMYILPQFFKNHR